MANTAYIVDHCQAYLAQHPGARVLDYGCGGGEVVAAGVAAGIDIYGCDLYYDGGDLSEKVPEALRGTRVQLMKGSNIPWEERSFDLVVSNQVFEHVEDLETVLKEITRVLKPGGKLLTIFPHREVWKEPHCGLPLMHWFPERSFVGTLWGFCFRCLGLGYFKNNMGRWAWSADFMDWIAKWTHYRSYSQLEGMFRKHFAQHQHLEVPFFEFRTAHRGWMQLLPQWLKLFIVRKWAGVVVEAQRG
jgi:SAM-dependent methyltransferase